MREAKLLAFTLQKLSAEKNKNIEGQIDVASDIKIKTIEKHKIDVVKQETIKIDFDFELKYGEYGKVLIQGFLILLLNNRDLKEIMSKWENNKEIQSDFRILVLNLIMQKCSIKALQLEEQMSLPPHIQIPRLVFEKDNQ